MDANGFRHDWRQPLCLVLSFVLTACGGDGGTATNTSQFSASSTSFVPTVAPETVPLLLTSNNMVPAGQLGIAFSEALLQVAQLAVDAIDQTRKNQNLVSTVTCENGAQATHTLTDADQNGRPSAGDSIRVSYSSCYQTSVDDQVSGDFVLTLTAPATTQGWDGTPSYAATVQFIAPFFIGSPADPTNVTGTLNIGAVRNGLKLLTAVSSTSSDDFAFDITSGGQHYIEAARQIQSSKLIDYSEARTYTNLDLIYRSQGAGGELRIATSQGISFTSYFGTYPDQGYLLVIGANQYSVAFRPRVYPGNTTVDVFLLPGTNFNVPAAAQSTDSWPNFTAGFMWWESATQPTVFSHGYKSRELNLGEFLLLFSQPNSGYTAPAKAPYYFQFSHRLDTNRLPTAHLTGPSQEYIPLTMTVDGARVTLTPTLPIQVGSTYQLTIDGAFWDQNVSNFYPQLYTFIAQ